MGMKEVNFFEQHVEKIVLAVAAAGAAFMGYLAIQPVNHPDRNIAPNEVETTISRELDGLKSAMDAVAAVEPKIQSRDYAREYVAQASGEPLPAALTKAQVPQFGPKNMAPSGAQMTQEENFRLVTPAPVAPQNPTGDAWQQLVGILPPNTVAPGATPLPGMEVVVLQPGVQLATRDQNATLIQGYIPVGRMLIEILKVQDPKERIPVPALQKAAIYRIRVQRRERTASSWGKFEDVKPTRGSPAPTEINWEALSDVADALTLVDAEFKQIVMPDFYIDQNGVPIQAPILSRPLPQNVESENKSLSDELRKLTGGAMMMPSGMPAIPAPAMTIPPGGTGAVATVGTPLQPRTVEEIKAMPFMPFDFWDDTVLPDHTYQYQVKVEFVNPTYGWKFGLKDSAMQKMPVLSTGWVLIAQPVFISSDVAFFITSGGFSSSDAVEVRLFKRNNGKLYQANLTTPLGTNIAGKVSLIDEKNRPYIDVDTHFTIVDVQSQAGSSNVHVILKDPNGVLVTRDSASDSGSTEMKNMAKQVVIPTAATAPAPGELPPAGAMPEVAPTAPRGTRSPYPTPNAPVPVNPPRVPTSRPARGAAG